jgi:hypothetical protein
MIIPLSVILILFENSQRYSQFKLHGTGLVETIVVIDTGKRFTAVSTTLAVTLLPKSTLVSANHGRRNW